MAHFKLVDRSRRFLPIVLESKLIPGSFEHALDILFDTETRQVAFFEKNQHSPLEFNERMRVAIDSERGRTLYAARMATVEPVFANLRHNKGLDRFPLRTRLKLNTQWTRYCLVHNIEKLAHHGYGG